jgi:hypothetical protein
MSRKCEIRIPRIKLSLKGAIPDDKKNFSKNFTGYLIDTTFPVVLQELKIPVSLLANPQGTGVNSTILAICG